MDGTPLDKAYTAAKNGDAAVLSGDFQKASEFFKEAAASFDEVRRQTPNNPSLRTLEALSGQYTKRAEYFSSGKAALDMKRHFAPSSSSNGNNGNSSKPFATLAKGLHHSPSSSTTTLNPGLNYLNSNIMNSPVGGGPSLRASQRMQPLDLPAHPIVNTPLGGNNTNNNNNSMVTSSFQPSGFASGQSGIVGPMGEAVNQLVMRSAAVFTRTFEQALAEKQGTNSTAGFYPAADMGNAPSESFYLVKPKSGKPEPTGNGSGGGVGNVGRVQLTNLERTQAIEQASEAQKTALKTGMRQILHEVATKEQQINDEHTEEVDRLRAESDRLRIQISKLKSRWEDLKESARKRQVTDQ